MPLLLHSRRNLAIRVLLPLWSVTLLAQVPSAPANLRMNGGLVQAGIYVASAASGSGDGSSCANAKVYTFFNSAGNWAATPTTGMISPDTTVHICGTISGMLNGSLFRFQGSGTSGHPITLIFESGATLTAPSWGVYNTSGAITASGVHDIVIDGNHTGTIIATANGTARANQQAAVGVFVSSCTRCTVQNLTVADIFVPSGSNPGSPSAAGIMAGTGNATLRITGNTIHDAYYCTWTVFNGDTNLEVDHNTISHCNWGVGGGAATSGATVTSYLIHDNDISDGGVWEDPADNNHHNGIYIFAEQTSSSVNGLQIYNNYVHGDFQLHVTGWIFISCQTGTIATPLIYNNLLTSSTVGSIPSNGFIMAWADHPSIYNNTIVGSTTSGGVGIRVSACSSATGIIKNNLITNVATGLYKPDAGNFEASDYNVFFNLSGNAMVNHSTFYGSVAAWTAATGLDTHSLTTAPLLNADGTLRAGSSAIGAAIDLSGLAIATLNNDKAGVARGTPWDTGAYKH